MILRFAAVKFNNNDFWPYSIVNNGLSNEFNNIESKRSKQSRKRRFMLGTGQTTSSSTLGQGAIALKPRPCPQCDRTLSNELKASAYNCKKSLCSLQNTPKCLSGHSPAPTSLGEPTTLPKPPSWRGRKYPSHTKRLRRLDQFSRLWRSQSIGKPVVNYYAWAIRDY